MSVLIIFYENRPQIRYRVWPDMDAIPEGWIAENKEYIFELENTDEYQTILLEVDDTKLKALRSPREGVARWGWSPGFFAGKVTLAIVSEHERRVFDLIVDPARHKLTRDHFDLMIEQILEDTFQLVSLSSYKIGIGMGNGTHLPPLARIEFLSSRIEELAVCIRKIIENPVKHLNGHLEKKPINRAGHITGVQLAKAYAKGRILKSEYLESRLPVGLKGYVPHSIMSTRKSAIVDIDEHRAIRSSLKFWSRWLMLVADKFKRVAKEDDESQSTKWAVRCEGLSRRLNVMVSDHFFDSITETNDQVTATSIFRYIPEYHRFFKLHRQMSLGLASITGDFLNIPIARTYDLYELWCFLRLVRILADISGCHDIDISGLIEGSVQTGEVVLQSKACSVRLENLEVAFQRSFREYWKDANSQGSFSRTMIPDVSVIKLADTEGPPLLFIFDAKYRVEQGLNDALASIHMYRDAIVKEDHEGVARIVQKALILSPQIQDYTDEDWTTQDAPARFFHTEYRDKFNFGIMSFHPAMDLAQMKILIKTAMELA